MLILADRYGALPIREKVFNVIGRLRKEALLTPEEICDSLELAYDPATSNAKLPQQLYKTLLIENMHKPHDGGSPQFSDCLEGTPSTKEGDFLWFMARCSEHSHFCGSCEKLIYSTQETTPANCPGCDSHRLNKISGSLVLANELW